MTQTPHEQLSQMTAVAGDSLSQTFGWSTHEARLYRDCPTAFWLAPDGDGALPPLPPGPVMPEATPVSIDCHPVDPIAVEGLSTGVFKALLVAGPVFAATGLMLSQADTDRDWWTPFGRALVSLVAFPLTITFGAILALFPVLIGVLALGAAGKAFPVVRKPAAWALTGGSMGIAIAALLDAGGTIAMALVATSMACAAIARTAVAWTEPELA